MARIYEVEMENHSKTDICMTLEGKMNGGVAPQSFKRQSVRQIGSLGDEQEFTHKMGSFGDKIA